MRFTVGVTSREELYETKTIRIAQGARGLFVLLAGVGAVAAASGWKPAAILLMVGLAGAIGSHLVVGVAGYRRAMRAPWPHVQPLADDDWD